MNTRNESKSIDSRGESQWRSVRIWFASSVVAIGAMISSAAVRVSPPVPSAAAPELSSVMRSGPCNCAPGEDSQYGWAVQFGINLGVMLFPFGFPSVPEIPGGIHFGGPVIELVHNDVDINFFSKSIGGGAFRVPRTIGLLLDFEFNYENSSCPESGSGESGCLQQDGTCGVGFEATLHPTVGQAYTVRIKKRCGWQTYDFTTKSQGSVDRSIPGSSFDLEFDSRSECHNICETVLEVFRGASELGYGSRLTNFRMRCEHCIRLD